MSSGGKGGSNYNPREVTNAQTAANEATALLQARLNRVNQNTPFGSIRFNPVAGGEMTTISKPWGRDNVSLVSEPTQYETTIELSPNQQRLLDLQEETGIGLGQLGVRQLGQIGAELEGPIDFAGLGDVPGMGSTGRSALEDALFSRIEPSIERDREALRTRLANQGIGLGSEAYSDAFEDFDRGVADTRTSVALQAGNEQARQMQARTQAINEMLMRRSVPINEITALTQGGQVTLPTMAAAPVPQTGVPATDAASGYAIQAQQDAARRAQTQGLYGGGLGLAGQLGAAALLGGGF